MTALALLASISTMSQVSAAEFFPIAPGMKWEYETAGDGAGAYRQTVGGAIDIEGTMMAPLNIVINSRVVQTIFYKVTTGGVFVLGSDPKKFPEKPQPVFMIDAKGAKWSFEGPSPYEDDKAAGMRSTGQSRMIGDRTYLGQKRECLEVKSETKIGLSESTATLIKQTTIYAKGLGMAEHDEVVQYGKRTTKRKVKLINFEAAQG